jgi:uncharacterized iron-regulated protein
MVNEWQMRYRHRCAALALLLLAGAAGADPLRLPLGDPARRGREVAVVVDGITDTATGVLATPAEFARRLAAAEVVFVGEEHTNAEAHAVQLAVLRAIADSGRPVTVALEMLPWTQQAALDEWVAGRLTEDEFLARSGWYASWGHHWNYYREIFAFARDRRLPMVGVNAPRDLVRRIRAEGFGAITGADVARFPPAIAPATDEYRQLFTASFGSGDALHTAPAALEGLLRAQLAWDAAMGWNARQALRADPRPGAVVVVLLGTGHVAYGLGAERQARADAALRTASVVPVTAGPGPARVQASLADFVWGVPPQAAPRYPVLGVSLRGGAGAEPTRLIQVAPDSPAAQSGLAVGDVLLAIGTAPVADEVAVRTALAALRWGDVVAVRFRRGDGEQTVTVPLRRQLPPR